MQISVLQEDLSKALSSSIRFINSRSSLPILGNFLLEAQKTKLKIKATNLEMSISTSIGAKADEEGLVTIPSKTFMEIIANLGIGQLNLSLEKEELKIKSNNFEAVIPTMPANDFPSIPEKIETKHSFSLSTSDLNKILSKILFSTSLDETRPVLGGVLFIFKKDSLSLVSSDGFRLSRKVIKLEGSVIETQIIIPRNALIELIKLSSHEEVIYFEVKKDENQLVVKIGDIFLSTRLIEGNFPDFEKIIPTSSTTTIKLDKNELLKAVKLASIFAREEASIIKIKTNESSLEIDSEGVKAGKQKSVVEASVEGDTSLGISFNYKFIEEFLNEVEGENIEIKLTDSVSPAIFIDPKDLDFLHIVMPVRVQN